MALLSRVPMVTTITGANAAARAIAALQAADWAFDPYRNTSPDQPVNQPPDAFAERGTRRVRHAES
jgi:hypothetical protein